MRVLHVIPAVARRYGGPSQALIEMCRALDRHGVEIQIATTDADGRGRLPVDYGNVTRFEDVPTRFFRRRLGDGFKYSPALARWIGTGVREFDVVHIHALFSHPALSAARACRAASVPYLLRPLGTLEPWALRQKRWRKRFLLWTEAGRALAGAAAVHYTTDEERRVSEVAIGPTAGVVVPLGIEDHVIADSRRSPATRQPIVLALTRLHPVKNLENLVRAFHAIVERQSDTPWRLVIAGEGDPAYRESLRMKAASGPAADRISFRGWVEGVDKQALLDTAALFVQPSFQESFGLSVLEACAHGVPVVVARTVNLSTQVVQAGAGWAVDGTASSLDDALSLCMRDQPDRLARGEAARRFATGFVWSRISERLAEVYDDVIRHKGRPHGRQATLPEVTAIPQGRP
jgi:glycosyltransferase involved in cell wall biosynthesis